MEIFYPPFWYDFEAKPQIVTAPDLLQYGESFTVNYEGSSSSVQVRCLTCLSCYCKGDQISAMLA